MTVRTRTLAAGAATAILLATAPAMSTSAAAGAAPLVSLTLNGKSMKSGGSLTVPTGPVRVRLTAVGDFRSVGLFQLKSGHTVKEVLADIAKSDEYPAVKRLAKEAIFRGGVEADLGSISTMTVNLKPGTYYLAEDADDPTYRYKKLTVTKTKGKGVAAKPTAAITLTQTQRIGGASTLPDKGTIKISNTATSAQLIHVATFFQVKDGTTAQQFMDAIVADGGEDVLLGGLFGTSAISPGSAQTLTYSMPRGTYALLCFVPGKDDLPHAFAGMIRMVKLK